jgi:hypothetical protein
VIYTISSFYEKSIHRIYQLYRWDIGATEQLPEYMKVCYQALLDIYSEMDQKIGEGRSYHIKYAREAVSVIYIYTQIQKLFEKILN